MPIVLTFRRVPKMRTSIFLALLAVAPATGLMVPRAGRALGSSFNGPRVRMAGGASVDENSRQRQQASYVAEKGLEGTGPMSVVNKIVPSGFRIALYALFGIAGAAGVGIAVTQNHPNDAVINGGGLMLVAGLAFFDVKSQSDQVDATMTSMSNDQLAKDLYSDDNVAIIDNVSGGATLQEPGGLASDGGDGSRIKTAAELFGEVE